MCRQNLRYKVAHTGAVCYFRYSDIHRLGRDDLEKGGATPCSLQYLEEGRKYIIGGLTRKVMQLLRTIFPSTSTQILQQPRPSYGKHLCFPLNIK